MFTPTRSTRPHSFLTCILFLLICLAAPSWAVAQEKDSEAPVGAVGGAVHADLFTGTATTSIPIEVPPGRQGVQPQLALVYGSANGNGWVGMGWKLEKSVIERRTKEGLDYTADDYVVRLSGINAELVTINAPTNTDFRAKIEGSFTRIRKLTATDGKPYFEATDKLGKKHLFGQTAASRLADPADPTRIFRWCLDRVEDVHGNYMAITYASDQGMAYLSQIDYTGNTAQSLSPTHSVIFHLEDRTDANPMYHYQFSIPVKTAKRLKTVEVRANGVLQRTYKLDYTTSASSGRSLLASVQQFGNDAVIDASGSVISGTSLPPITTGWQTDADGTFTFSNSLPGASLATQSYLSGTNQNVYSGDWNGDGLTDLLHLHHVADPQYSWVALSNGDGTFDFDNTKLPGSSVATNSYIKRPYSVKDIYTGDWNGDGLTDLFHLYPHADPQYSWVALSNGDGTFTFNRSLPGASTATNSYITTTYKNIYKGDWNGDGLMDLLHLHPSSNPQYSWVALSNGDGTFTFSQSLPGASTATNSYLYSSYRLINVGDWNGDGLTDLLHLHPNANPQYSWVALSNGDGTFTFSRSLPGASVATKSYLNSVQDVQSGDWNGDGLTDLFHLHPSADPQYSWVALSNGDGTFTFSQSLPGATWATNAWRNGSPLFTVSDWNGDGLTDLLYKYPNNDPRYSWVALSNGDGTFTFSQSLPGGAAVRNIGDWNGDGLMDFLTLIVNADPQYSWVALSNGSKPDLLTSLDNGLGGSTTIDYVPSTQFSNTLLPYVTQVVGSVTTNDGNGNISATTYGYAGGYHHLAEREFRGFHSAKSIGPAGPNGEQTVTETWFHQGNDTAVGVNNPGAPDGYLKGAPYQTQVSDGLGNLYTNTATTYTPDSDGVAPFYTPPAQVIADVCDGNASCVQTRTDFTYDIYGNILQGISYGDVTDPADDRTRVNTYAYNTTDWLLSFPSSATLYEGIGTAGTMMSHADLYYDGTTSCAVASTNQVPTKGLLTRSVNWLNGGTSPETRLAYNALGNPICSRDANGNTSTMAYDSQGVFETSVTNALGHATTTQYYGVDSVLQDNGLYGQIKQVTDPNAATVSSTYDKLGRVLTVTQPDGFTVTKSYVDLGTVGTQHVHTTNDLGLSSWVYFDGLGRNIFTASTGTDGKFIATSTIYNIRGAVHAVSLPYFQGDPVPGWTIQSYDPMGRVTRTDNPDGTFTLQCYDDWISVAIDANGHKSRQTRNVFGKPSTIREYEGVFTTCDTALGTPYSTTTYQYDVQENLRFTTDALGNQTEMQYDTLSRKIFMHDPDMGNWSYAYDAMDNLTLQTDAKGQLTYLQYDALNRVVQKDYGTQKALGSGDVVNTYDGVTSNGTGRLTQVNDSSGSNTLYYDTKGQLARSDQVINSTTYTTQTAYDGLGRTTSITYPDNSVVTYTYNGPQLATVVEGSTTHISYGGYNAQGQPATVTYGNGVTTSYTYNPLNTRLDTLQTVNSISTTFIDLDYAFDPAGNINSIIDPIRGNQTFSYDSLNRLITASGPYGPVNYSYNPIGNMLSNSQVGVYSYNASGPASVRPHAVTGAGVDSYTYDANGNMTGGAGRTLTYDFENRPTQITKAGVTTDLVYDGDGGRVMKTAGGVSTVYVGKLYVCEAGLCSRMIFGNDQRIAEVETLSGAPRYYHTDHLGSTGVVTDSFGNNIQDLTYHPYGDTFSNAGSVDLAYKYTGKELDDSTDLYFYEARYYDVHLARFISADTLVPDPSDPQAFNRYAYALNNPIRYNDPSGHITLLPGLLQSGALFLGSSLMAANDWAPAWGASGVFVHRVDGTIFNQNPASLSQIAQMTRNSPLGIYNNLGARIGFQLPSFHGLSRAPKISSLDVLNFTVETSWTVLEVGLVTASFYTGAGEAAALYQFGRFVLQNVFKKSTLQAIKNFFGRNATEDVLKGAQNPKIRDALRRGQQVHKDRQYPAGFEKEVRLPSGKRMDAYNGSTKEIIELKPNNIKAIRQGERQVERYCRECDQVYGRGHKGRVEIYD